MPNNTVSVTTSWAQITTGNVTAMRVQNVGGHDMWIMATAGETPPTTIAGAILVRPGQTFVGDLAEFWPGVSGANRIYARADSNTSASWSHA